MYPRLEIDTEKLRENAKIVCNILKKNNLEVAIVTKGYCAIESVVEELAKEDIDYIADSRIENLKNLQNIDLPKILLRIPMISELEDVIKYCDISFNSEKETILKLNEVAKSKNVIHKVVIMVDLGDLREGYFKEEEVLSVVEEVISLENIKLIGLATNLTCYGGIIPSKDNLQRLVDIGRSIEEKYNIKLDFISGGNTSSLYLAELNQMPKGITNLRLGEAIILGTKAPYSDPIDGCHNDAFKLVCEIIEIKDKPSIPIGEVGLDAFGKKPVYVDNGIRKRAIIGIGKQDIHIDSVYPIDESIKILGASSDHMILDITDCEASYGIGDKLEFLLGYGGIMSVSTSKYVHKEVIKSGELSKSMS